MLKRIIILAFFVLLAAASPAVAGEVAKNDEARAKDFVDKGIAHVQAVGAEQAAKDFMDPDAGFMDGSFYLLFYQYDGICLALGARPEVAGKNRWDVQDPRGVYQIREMVKAAQTGGGWVEYKYANPSTSEIQDKRTWVLPVPGMEAFIGCGVY